MKRIIAIVLALCFSLNVVLASFSMNAVAAEADSTAETESTKEAETKTSPAASESSDSNPIGTNSSYYNIHDLSDQPDIVAESATLIDARTGAVLYQKKADSKRYPASITKVMTALLTIENCKMDDIVTFSDSAVNGVEAGSSSAGIPVGAQLTVEETLYALMLASANEAAAALAEQVSGSVGEFAKLMTARAQELGCTNTTFQNPHGLPDEAHLTSAHDMALIVKEAMKSEEFRKFAGTVTYTISKRQGISEPIELWNHAKILRESSDFYYEYAEGAKTGFTQAALNTLISFAKKGDVELIAVILKDHGAENSYKDSIALYNWGFKQVKGLRALADFDLHAALASCDEIDEDQLSAIEALEPSFNKDYYTLVKDSIDTANLSESFELNEDKEAGILGYININYDGERIGQCPVTYDTTTDAAASYIDGKSNVTDSGEKEKSKSTGSSLLRSLKAILIFLGCVIILMLIMAVIIINYMKNKKRKRRQANLAKKIHHDANPNGQKTRPRNSSANRPAQRPGAPRKAAPSGRPSSSQPHRRPSTGSAGHAASPRSSEGSGQRVRRRRSERNR